MPAGLQLDGLVIDGGSLTPRHEEFAPGTVVALIGPSGGQRTRLLMTIAGLEPPRSGSVLLNGAAVIPADVGVVDEDHVLVDALTAIENVAARVMARHSLHESDPPAITDLLASLGLPESSWHNLAEQLSGGQQQRVAIARALADDPVLLCLDDPTSELDATSAALVWTQVAAAATRGAIVLLGLPDREETARANVVIELTH